MNIDFEKTPAVLFDWVETFSFEQLNPAQQKEVLVHLSEEAYNEMHRTSIDLKSASALWNDDFSDRKELLLVHFDRHHKQELGFKGHMIWQAAAVLLLMLSGWLFYQVFDLKKEPVIKQMASIDTVYVDREVTSSPEVVHDTVYRYKKLQNNDRESAYQIEITEKEEIAPLNDMIAVPVLELENFNTTPKGNSMKDDSLLKKFGFVAM